MLYLREKEGNKFNTINKVKINSSIQDTQKGTNGAYLHLKSFKRRTLEVS
jgi:hypothetical protein